MAPSDIWAYCALVTSSAIGGYSIVRADGLDDAMRLFANHPHLAWGGTIEILEVLALPGM